MLQSQYLSGALADFRILDLCANQKISPHNVTHLKFCRFMALIFWSLVWFYGWVIGPTQGFCLHRI